MSIYFDDNLKMFKLDTQNTSYMFCVSCCNVIEHLYYGEKIEDLDIKSVANRQVYSFAEHENIDDRSFTLSTILQEYSFYTSGDLRVPSAIILGDLVSQRFRYSGHKIYEGKKEIENMPSSRNNNNVMSLELNLINDDCSIEVILHYSVYENEDIICRHTEIKNLSTKSIELQKIASFTLDFCECDYSLLTIDGMYLCERSHQSLRKLERGIQGISSACGTTSHYTNPFFALVKGSATEDEGEVYGFNLVYSSNFKNEIEVDRLGNTRVVSGINDTGFLWTLNKDERFITPEVIFTYSNDGVGGMSRNFHDHIRNNIIENKYLNQPRPIVINTWEGAYFSVDEKLVLDFAIKGKECGVDTVVLDDGWFRNNTKDGLGDWKAIKEKFHSLKELSKKIHSLGMKFGIWIEPEMVAVESELYHKGPNIILSTEKKHLYSRNQFYIDLTLDKNIELVAKRIIDEFNGVDIDYIKWDCNRYPTDASSFITKQGEVYHRQILGTYKLFNEIKKAYPNVLFENCSGGGGRFDLGMLYYSPQIWASDNTDPFERVYIQYGTSLAYPTSTISCHFSEGVCTSGRISKWDFRYGVASFGPFGYELNLNKYSKEDYKKFKAYSLDFRKNEKFVLNSDLYRLISPETDEFCAYMQVTKDKSNALLTFIEINTTGHTENMLIHIKGLSWDKKYKNESTGEVLFGKTWEKVGIRIDNLFNGKGGSCRQIYFTEVK